MRKIDDLKVKLFADGADRVTILQLSENPAIKGFTTNPTLMRKAGITDYESFARDIVDRVGGRPISFEVFADEFDEMERQAHIIASWGRNVYVKVPVTNTQRKSAAGLIHRLSHAGVKINATALMAAEQVREIATALAGGAPSYISVFAGRIADTGRDPIPFMQAALDVIRPYSEIELIWASPRELLNVFQADQIGCHVITATNDILKKLELVGRDLSLYSLDTVCMFYEDALRSGFQLAQSEAVGAPELAASV